MHNNPKIVIINGPLEDPLNRCWGSSETVKDISMHISNMGFVVDIISVEYIQNFSFEGCLAFPNCYWTSNTRETLISHFLEGRGIPYVGGPSWTNTLVDRTLFKDRLRSIEIDTPQFCIVDSKKIPLDIQFLKKPWVVKTAFDGNSRGVEIAYNREQLEGLIQDFEPPLVIEEWSKTKEYTICFVGSGAERVFFISEINCEGVFDQEKKEQGMGQYCIPVRSEEIKNKLISLSGDLLGKIPVLDWGRIDILYNQSTDKYQIIDLNFLPGLKAIGEPKSLFVTTFERETCLPYYELVRQIIYSSIKRYQNLGNNVFQF